uniref:LRAT domain-containing protein n=1 Tax=Pundamilia nyererei TaxID=303518 RepID=A0A3B4GYS3_9CICH
MCCNSYQKTIDVKVFLSCDDKKPQPGDLIEISRGLYAHWAVYVGDDFVVHFGVPDLSPGSKAVSSQTVEGRVMKEKLESVAGKDKWQVKNSLDGKYKPRLAKEIVKDALASVGKARKYNLKESNCEHFANEMRYGVAVSQQVDDIMMVLPEWVSAVTHHFMDNSMKKKNSQKELK